MPNPSHPESTRRSWPVSSGVSHSVHRLSQWAVLGGTGGAGGRARSSRRGMPDGPRHTPARFCLAHDNALLGMRLLTTMIRPLDYTTQYLSSFTSVKRWLMDTYKTWLWYASPLFMTLQDARDRPE